jgi:hypothetical protein
LGEIKSVEKKNGKHTSRKSKKERKKGNGLHSYPLINPEPKIFRQKR